MKQLWLRLERGLMFVTVFLPLSALLFHKILAAELFGTMWFAAQTLIVSLLALLPAYVGNYTETEVIRYEGGINRGGDPNPDRESRHETVKQGHRFPLRFTADIIAAGIFTAAALLLPGRLFAGEKFLCKFVFVALITVLDLMSMTSIAQSYCPWTEIPGVALGFVSYLGLALFLKFSKADNSVLNTVIGAGALVFVFVGGVCLNRQSLNITGGNGPEERKAPANVVRRNRFFVLGFSGFVALTSFVKPIRSGAVWLFNQLMKAVKWIGWLLRGGEDVYEGDTPAFEQMMQGGAAEVGESAIEEGYTGVRTFDKVLVLGFFILMGICFLWLMYDRFKKLMQKLNELMERFARGVNEGYYDEKENLAKPDESRKKLKDILKEKVKNLLTFETPWEKLDGRGKAVRLVRELYKKRWRRVNRIRTLTAREALSKMSLKGDTAPRAADAYERARYSSHEVDSAAMDKLRKDI